MLSNLNKILLFFAFLLTACQEEVQQSSEYEKFIQHGSAVVVLADNYQCWNCEKYYWVLTHLLRKNPDMRVVWVSRKLKELEKITTIRKSEKMKGFRIA